MQDISLPLHHQISLTDLLKTFLFLIHSLPYSIDLLWMTACYTRICDPLPLSVLHTQHILITSLQTLTPFHFSVCSTWTSLSLSLSISSAALIAHFCCRQQCWHKETILQILISKLFSFYTLPVTGPVSLTCSNILIGLSPISYTFPSSMNAPNTFLPFTQYILHVSQCPSLTMLINE